MEKEASVKKVAVVAPAPEEATPTLIVPPTPAKARVEEPGTQDKCYKKTVGEEATFLETAKDYFNQFKEMPAKMHWICLKNYFNRKCGSVFGKEKVEPVLKDETTEVAAKPAAAAPTVESH